jgi:succinate-acetate transporter protein
MRDFGCEVKLLGPVLLLLGTIFEWVMGNFFPMMVMSLFAVFWLSFGLLQVPTLGLAAAYSATGDAVEGAASKEYNAVVGLYLIVWGFALFTFWIFTLKTNAVFAGIFGFVTLAAWVLAGAYFKVGSGDYETAGKLQKVCSTGYRACYCQQTFHLMLLVVPMVWWVCDVHPLTVNQAGGALLFIVAILG